MYRYIAIIWYIAILCSTLSIPIHQPLRSSKSSLINHYLLRQMEKTSKLGPFNSSTHDASDRIAMYCHPETNQESRKTQKGNYEQETVRKGIDNQRAHFIRSTNPVVCISTNAFPNPLIVYRVRKEIVARERLQQGLIEGRLQKDSGETSKGETGGEDGLANTSCA